MCSCFKSHFKMKLSANTSTVITFPFINLSEGERRTQCIRITATPQKKHWNTHEKVMRAPCHARASTSAHRTSDGTTGSSSHSFLLSNLGATLSLYPEKPKGTKMLIVQISIPLNDRGGERFLYNLYTYFTY